MTKKEGAGRLGVGTSTGKPAISWAKGQAMRKKVEVVIHGSDNKIRGGYSYSRHPGPPKDKKH